MHICLSHELPSRFVRFWVLFPENKWDLGTREDSDNMPKPHPPRRDAQVALFGKKEPAMLIQVAEDDEERRGGNFGPDSVYGVGYMPIEIDFLEELVPSFS